MLFSTLSVPYLLHNITVYKYPLGLTASGSSLHLTDFATASTIVYIYYVL